MPQRFLMVFLLSATMLVPGVVRADDARSMATRDYQIADIVTPVDGMHWMFQNLKAYVGSDPKGSPEAVLTTYIMESVAPASWACNGGNGNIHYYPQTKKLEIVQTAFNHEDIESLLSALRRLQELQVTLDCQRITVTRETWENIQRDDTLILQVDDVRIQDAVQNRSTRKRLNTDPGVVIGNARKILASNGQTECFTEESPKGCPTVFELSVVDGAIRMSRKANTAGRGRTLELRPIVSADRQSVRLHIEQQLMEPEEQIFGPLPIPLSPDRRSITLLMENNHKALGLPELIPVTVPVALDSKSAGITVTAEYEEFHREILFQTSIALSDGDTAIINPEPSADSNSVTFTMVTARLVVWDQDRLAWREGPAIQEPVVTGRQADGSMPATRQATAAPARMPTVAAVSAQSADPKASSQAVEHKPDHQSEISTQAEALSALIRLYDNACQNSRNDDAERFARAALAINPLCFRR